MNKIQKRKQSIGKRVPCFWEDDDDDDIAAVAEILIQLPDLILYAKPSSSLTWGAKRRRSAISGAKGTKSVVFATTAAATSPMTPLMFSPSESDEKTNNNTPSCVSTISNRKNKDELIHSVADLTHQKHFLVKEMEAVKSHLGIVRASNLELKHCKQVTLYSTVSGIAQHLLQIQTQQQRTHYPFQMQYPSIQWSTIPSVPAVNKLESVRLTLPDLNLTLEEAANNVDGFVGGSGGYYQASNVTTIMDQNVNSRALASAEARKRRMQIYKEKNQNQVLRQR